MKNLSLTFCLSFIFTFSFAQTWQRTFEINYDPVYVEETELGNLEIHYEDNDQQLFKLIVSSVGDSLGIEYYPPPSVSGYFELSSSIQVDDSLSYFDSDDNLIWKIDIEDIYSPNTFYNEDFIFIRWTNLSGTTCSNGSDQTIWIYNKAGELIYHSFANGPRCLNSFHIIQERSSKFIVQRASGSGFLPQGAGGSNHYFQVVDSTGNILCTKEGELVYLANSNVVQGVDINGVGNCQSIGYLSSNDQHPFPYENEGQYTPCSNYIIPEGYGIPVNKGMIGLQTNAFAILGSTPFSPQNITTLTRIDCSNPFENLCLYRHEVNLSETICEGNVYTVANMSFSASGNYEVPLTDMNGCDSIIHLELTVDSSSLVINPIVNDLESGSIELNSNCVNCTFEWNNGEMTENVFDLNSGLYEVTITEPSGCISIFDFEISLTSSTIQNLDGSKIFFKNLVRLNENVIVSSKSPQLLSQVKHLRIIDTAGKIILSKLVGNIVEFRFVAPSYSGLFFIELRDHQDQIVIFDKLIVQ